MEAIIIDRIQGEKGPELSRRRQCVDGAAGIYSRDHCSLPGSAPRPMLLCSEFAPHLADGAEWGDWVSRRR